MRLRTSVAQLDYVAFRESRNWHCAPFPEFTPWIIDFWDPPQAVTSYLEVGVGINSNKTL
jgi:hypothetical protein